MKLIMHLKSFGCLDGCRFGEGAAEGEARREELWRAANFYGVRTAAEPRWIA